MTCYGFCGRCLLFDWGPLPHNSTQHPLTLPATHCLYDIYRGQIQRKTWDPMPELTITSPYVHSRTDSNTFTVSNPMPESALSPGPGLWIWPLLFAVLWYKEGGGGVEPKRRFEGQQFTKLGRKYHHDWLFLPPVINSDKHLRQSLFTGSIFLDDDILLWCLCS